MPNPSSQSLDDGRITFRDNQTQDPVCGKQVEMDHKAVKALYEGITFYFCSESCKQTFVGKPHEYQII